MSTSFFNESRWGVVAKKLTGLLLLATIGYLDTACQNEIAPAGPVAAKGTLLVTAAPAYFNLSTEHTEVVIYLNDKKLGTLTRGFVYLNGQTSPKCDATSSGAVLRFEAELGAYTLKSEVIRPN